MIEFACKAFLAFVVHFWAAVAGILVAFFGACYLFMEVMS